MNELAPLRHFDPADEELLLATIDRWLEKDVRPVVKQFDHEDRWPTVRRTEQATIPEEQNR